MRTWTAEARAAQAQKIRAHKPWLHSTGPRTVAGKARVATNALKHGNRGSTIKRFRRLLRLQALFLKLQALKQSLPPVCGPIVQSRRAAMSDKNLATLFQPCHNRLEFRCNSRSLPITTATQIGPDLTKEVRFFPRMSKSCGLTDTPERAYPPVAMLEKDQPTSIMRPVNDIRERNKHNDYDRFYLVRPPRQTDASPDPDAVHPANPDPATGDSGCDGRR